MKKIFEYFIKKPFLKSLFLITTKQPKNIYCFFFNFYTLINLSKAKIFLKDGFFFIKDSNWRFSNRHIGLMTYFKGLKNRGKKLYSIYLLKNINFEINDTIIDIGANNGDFFLCFDNKINYYGIEPSPTIFENLSYNIKNQNLLNIAMWKTEEKVMKFFLKDEFGDSSLIPMENYTKEITVKTKTLDSLIDKIQTKIKLIKLEAEGAEPEILEGLNKNLNRVEYITIDAGYERGMSQESTLVKCTNYLLSNNFELVDFDSKSKRVIILFKNNFIQ